MALGAQQRDVVTMELRRGMTLTAIGIVLGVLGAIGLTRYLDGMLYQLTPLDPATYVVVPTLFGLVSSLASYLPARRATMIDPMTALRCD